MEIEKYISFGILEAYALGDLTQAEKAEVEKMASMYPEIRAELAVVEDTLKSIAFHTAVSPRNELKEKILQKVFPKEAPELASEQSNKSVQFTPLHKKEKIKKINRLSSYNYLLAAAISFAVLSSGAAAFFWNKWQEAENQLSMVAAERTFMVQQFKTVESRLEYVNRELAVYTSENFNKIILKGLALAPEAAAAVFWNKQSGEVFLNPSSLPTIPTDKQYQLWAIVDGQPVDMGMITPDKDGTLIKMKEVENAQAFAITLEPTGGSPSPTLDQMFVLGEVS